MGKYDQYKESAFTHEVMQPMKIEIDMTDIIEDPNDICGWLDNLAHLEAKDLNHPATLDGLRGIGRDAKLEIERLRAALRLGVEARQAQRAYFKDRTQSNLIASKQAETAFDKAARDALGEKE